MIKSRREANWGGGGAFKSVTPASIPKVFVADTNQFTENHRRFRQLQMSSADRWTAELYVHSFGVLLK